MGLFDFFKSEPEMPELSDEFVTALETQAKESSEQLKLMRRYIKAHGTIRVNQAESEHLFKLGNAIADEQINAIHRDGKAAIQQARTMARSSSQKALSSYAQSLIKRGN
jgi:hypothetical protein